MATLNFAIFARDVNAARTFRDVGDEAERAGKKIHGLGDAAAGLRGHMSGLTASFSGLGSQFASVVAGAGQVGVTIVATAAKFATLVAAVATAASSIGGLAAALAPAGGIIAALPGAVLAGAAALGVFKLAVYGVSDAMKAAYEGDGAKFEKALAQLTPAAADFAREFQAIVPRLKEFQQAAQTGFFAELNGHLAEFVEGLRSLQPLITGLAAEMGRWASFAAFVTAQTTVVALATVIDLVRQGLSDLRVALGPLLQGFLDLGVVGAEFLRSLAPGIAAAAARFGEFLSQAASSGQAMQWLTAALDVFRQLGEIAVDVGGILSGVFDAMRASGSGALGVLGQLLDGMNAWVNSARGQAVLVEVFTSLHQIAQAFLPVIAALVSGIGALAPTIAALATAIGPILAAAINAVVPALQALGPGILAAFGALGQAVQVLAPALAPIASAISGVMKAVAPLIPIAAQIAAVLAGLLVGALRTLAPAFVAVGEAVKPALAALGPGVTAVAQGVVAAVQAITPALLPVGQAFSAVLQALSPLLPLVGQLAALIATSLASGVQAVMPSLRILVTAVSDAARALAPLIPMIIDLAATFINALVPALAPLLPALAQLIAQLAGALIPAITPLIPIIAQIASVLAQGFVSALQMLMDALLPLIPVLSDYAQTIGKAWLDALVAVMPSILDVVDAVLQLIPALTPIIPMIADLAKELLPFWVAQAQALAPVVVELVYAVLELLEALMPLLPTLVDAATKLLPIATQAIQVAAALTDKLIPAFEWLVGIVKGAVDAVVGAFNWLYDKLIGHSIIPDLVTGIVGWIGSLPDKFLEFFGKAKDWAVQKFTELVDWAKGLPGMLLNAIGDLGGTLRQKGVDLITGFWNGMVSMFDDLKNRIYDFFSQIMPDWVKSALGIASPSKVFAAIGRQLPAGMALGIQQASGMVQDAAERMAGLASVGATISPALSAASTAPAVPAVAGGNVVNLYLSFAGQPLITQTEIARTVIDAVNAVAVQGFNLGVLAAQ